MRDLLFSVPWWLPTVLGIAGLALLVRGNRHQNSTLRRVGTGLLVFAVAWATISYLVDTPRETCEKQTRRFVRSVVDRDWKSFDALLAPDAGFRWPGSQWRIDGRDAIDAMIKGNVEYIGLKSASISGISSSQTDAAVTVSIKVWSNQEISLERPIDSEWEMEWRPAGSEWRLREVRAIRVNGVTPATVRDSLRNH